MYDFKFADIGDGILEGKILEWKFKEGENVSEGDTLVIVETDKVNAELPSPVSGVIKKLGKEVGEMIYVGETVVIIDDGSGASVEEEKEEDKVEEKGASVIGEIQVTDDLIEPSSEMSKPKAAPLRKKALATPVARNLAKQLGIDINEVVGTGPNGRVMKDDIRNHAGATTPTPSTTYVPRKAEVSKQGDVSVTPVTQMRKSISNAMTRSKQIVADTVLLDEVVIDRLVELRNNSKELAAKQGVKLTYMAFISKAVVMTLKEYPIFNSSFDHDTFEIVYKNFINLGFAVDTKDGLIVPNIKDANNLSVFELAREIDTLATQAHDRTIQLANIQNGTFSITNFGTVGVSHGTPVINYPEVAILGLGKIDKKAVVRDNEIVIAHVLPLSLAVDHRIIDGADAGRFLMRVKEYLENPELMLLG